MAPKEQQPQRSAVLSLLLFSEPPKETPSIFRAAVAVTGAHAIVLSALLWMVVLMQRSELPSGAMDPPDVLDFELISLPIGLGSPAGPAPAQSRRSPSRPRPAQQSVAAALPVPFDPPAVVPPSIPPAVLGTPLESFKTPVPPPVAAVAPRGVAPPASGNGNGAAEGMGNGSRAGGVEGMSIDELAREPVFTPFTQAPELINRAEIRGFLQTRYPVYMSARGIGGRAVLWILIDAGGGIRKAVLLRSSGSAVLDDAALEAIDRMEFRPAINQGKRVPVWVQLPVSFQPDW